MRVVIPAVDLFSGDTIAYTNTLNKTTPMERVKWKNDILMSEAMMASAAVPGVFQPMHIGRMCIVDGGVTNFMPVDLLISAGEKNILAVDLADEYTPMNSENIIEVVSHALSIMNISLRECGSRGEVFTIKPKLPEDGGLLSFDRMVEYMQAGYEATRELLPQLKKIL